MTVQGGNGKSVLTTVYPSTFQQEPIDMVGFDIWQDWEGLQDASEACRGEFTRYRETWRKARAEDLKRAEETITDWKSDFPKSALDTWRKARRLGAGLGMITATKPVKLSGGEKRAFEAWRSRVLRADPAAWWQFWNVATGTNTLAAAEQWNVSERYLIGVIALLCRWLDAELWQTTNSVGEPV